MQDNSNNQNPPASSVEEYEPDGRERVEDTCNQVGKLAVFALLAGAVSGLAFGICVGVTRGDASQCIAPPVIVALIVTPSLYGFNRIFNFFRESQLYSADQVARIVPEISGGNIEEASALEGIPVFRIPSAPEFISTFQSSSEPERRGSLSSSPRLSFDHQGVSFSQNSTSEIQL
jgi:hypothetical protein